eukprot:922876-Karenia_brevis.AAC.1
MVIIIVVVVVIVTIIIVIIITVFVGIWSAPGGGGIQYQCPGHGIQNGSKCPRANGPKGGKVEGPKGLCSPLVLE